MQRLIESAPIVLRPLPPDVARLLAKLAAPPRLVAHLALVHDVAVGLCRGVEASWPGLAFDREAVLVGAATHDIGKIVYPDELSQPGMRHEEVGEGTLLEHGFPPRLARFARTHGGLVREPHPTLEDWLVMLADHVWKGARRPPVEDGARAPLAERTGSAEWEVHLRLDDILTELSSLAVQRLAWHGAQSVSGVP